MKNIHISFIDYPKLIQKSKINVKNQNKHYFIHFGVMSSWVVSLADVDLYWIYQSNMIRPLIQSIAKTEILMIAECFLIINNDHLHVITRKHFSRASISMQIKPCSSLTQLWLFFSSLLHSSRRLTCRLSSRMHIAVSNSDEKHTHRRIHFQRH